MDTLTHYLPSIMLTYGIAALGILSPGPNVLAVMGTSKGEGRPHGKALALGISAGSFLWAVLTWAGLVTIIAAYAWALVAFKIAGGLYLLWLAFKAFRSAMQVVESKARDLAGLGGHASSSCAA